MEQAMAAYTRGPLALTITHVLTRGQDELTREESIRITGPASFVWLGAGFQMEASDGRLLAELGAVPDRVVDVPVGESLLRSIESVLAESAPVPAVLIAWQGGSRADWIAALTGGLLGDATPTVITMVDSGVVIKLVDGRASATIALERGTNRVSTVQANRPASGGRIDAVNTAYAATYVLELARTTPDTPIVVGERRVVADVEGLRSQARATASIGVGDTAPNFVLPLLGGGEVSMESLRGSVVLLDFWATWCAPCRAGLPEIEKVYQATGQNTGGVLVFGVNVMEGRSSETLRMKNVGKFWQGEPISFPTLVAMTESLVTAWGVGGIPMTVVIGPDGTVLERVDGFTRGEWTHLLEVIEQAVPEETQQP
jgi:thiol-disulfide isomerase/thioredoxin